MIVVFIIALSLLLDPFNAHYADAMPSHLDIANIPGGCSACHKGHGKSGTPMLKQKKDQFCFVCHSSTSSVRFEGNVVAVDIYSEMLKQSGHPVLDTAQYHFRNEELPERSSSAPRHVSCYDCHDVHQIEKGNKMKGISGYSGKGSKVRQVRETNDYALCYKCHSDSANLPISSPNLSNDFDPSNRSFHPIESIGRSRFVPSLKSGLTTSSRIKCTDCHGNDDDLGPKGPHGSRYSPLLKYNYSRREGTESITAYDLCYNCHERNSILNDESFKAHKRHVVYGRVSCAGCHNAHGSRDHDALIDFDETLVLPTTSGQLNYFSLAPGKPKCILVCHIGTVDYNHDEANGQYCVNASCPPGW